MTEKLIAFIEVEVKDKAGNILYKQKKEANSLVKGFISLLCAQMVSNGVPNQQIIDGSYVTANPNASTLASIGTAGGLQGIVVGTGTGTVSLTDHKLDTVITHGIGNGQLQYAAGGYTYPVTSGNTQYFTISKIFTNGSAGTINATEVGIYAYNGAAGYNMCIDRTLLAFSVLSGATATITYTIQVTV